MYVNDNFTIIVANMSSNCACLLLVNVSSSRFMYFFMIIMKLISKLKICFSVYKVQHYTKKLVVLSMLMLEYLVESQTQVFQPKQGGRQNIHRLYSVLSSFIRSPSGELGCRLSASRLFCPPQPMLLLSMFLNRSLPAPFRQSFSKSRVVDSVSVCLRAPM